MSRPSLVPIAAPLICGLALFTTGCLGEPATRTCADLPPGTAGCESDADPGPDVGPDLDLGPDQGGDGGPGPDDGPDDGPDEGPDDGPDDGLDLAVDTGVVDMTPDGMTGECAPGTSRPCGSNEGACQAGQQFCNADGEYDACLGAIGPTDEACNGADDDCNGMIDEGCDCVDDTTQVCGSDEGACVAGRQVCADGAWGPCEGRVDASDEVCNGQDDDCNGETDEGCDCIDDMTQVCGSDEGACESGVQICAGGAWGPCEGRVDGAEEICDGVDNDCNGAIDDLPAVVNETLCTVGSGECRATGQLTCENAPVGAPICSAEPGPPVAEACNRLDDDCDGTVDEEVPTGRANLFEGAERDIEAVAIAPYGEFHGVAWIDDDRVMFGLALGSAWEIEPVDVGAFGDDTIAESLALAHGNRGEFYVVVAYDGLGSGVIVLRINSGGEELGRFNVDINRSAAVDVASAGEQGYAVAFTEHNGGIDSQDVGIDRVRLDGTSTRYTIAGGQTHVRAPSVVMVDDHPIVAVVRADPRALAGNLELVIHRDGGRPTTTVISDSGTANNPDLRYLPIRELYALAWQETERGSERIKVALIDRAGRVVERLTMPSGADPARPSVVPMFGGRDGVNRLAVTWDRSSAQGFNIDLGWALLGERGWEISPAVTRVYGEQGATIGAAAAYAPEGIGLGVVFSYDDTRSQSVVLSTLPSACPEQP